MTYGMMRLKMSEKEKDNAQDDEPEKPKNEPTEHQVNDEYRKKGVGVWA